MIPHEHVINILVLFNVSNCNICVIKVFDVMIDFYSKCDISVLVVFAGSKTCLTLHDFELATPCDGQHDANTITTLCSVRPSAILSVMIRKIRGNHSPS